MKKPRSHKRPIRNREKEAVQKKKSTTKKAETKENLVEMLKEYEAKARFYEFRAARLKDLLSRRSVESLSEHKRRKLTRQFEEASEEHSFAQVALDQIAFRISQIQE